MPIAKNARVIQAKELIEYLLKKDLKTDYVRTEIGKALNDLGKKYGYEAPNKLIKEYSLDQKMDLHPYCPLLEKIQK